MSSSTGCRGVPISAPRHVHQAFNRPRPVSMNCCLDALLFLVSRASYAQPIAMVTASETSPRVFQMDLTKKATETFTVRSSLVLDCPSSEVHATSVSLSALVL